MSLSLVSVVICNYNYGRFLRDAIDSALHQTYSQVEVIVVDDGSTDDSRQIIATYGDKIVPVFKENGGHASAYNAGFAVSKGDIICFLDSDDLFFPNKIAAVVEGFGREPDIGWCVHRLYNWDMARDSLPPEVAPPAELKDIVVFDFRQQIAAGQQPYFLPPASAVSCTRSLLEQMMPVPEEGRYLYGDFFVETVATYLSKGTVINHHLGYYRKHGSNVGNTDLSKARVTSARVRIVTGYWMSKRFPGLRNYCNITVAKGLGVFWLSGGSDPKCQDYLKKYLASISVPERAKVLTWAGYYAASSLLRRKIP